jgi:hypothetical protein
VAGGHEYVIRGSRGGVAYLSFAIYAGGRPGQGSTQPAHLDSSRLVTQADGSFTVGWLAAQLRGCRVDARWGQPACRSPC